jgi:hypothetical protein
MSIKQQVTAILIAASNLATISVQPLALIVKKVGDQKHVSDGIDSV